jgi:hypothetical protein
MSDEEARILGATFFACAANRRGIRIGVVNSMRIHERPLPSVRLGFYFEARAILDRRSFGRESGFQKIDSRRSVLRNGDIRIDDPPSGLDRETVVGTGIKILAFEGEGGLKPTEDIAGLAWDACGI